MLVNSLVLQHSEINFIKTIGFTTFPKTHVAETIVFTTFPKTNVAKTIGFTTFSKNKLLKRLVLQHFQR